MEVKIAINNIGNTGLKCRICGNESENELIIARERHLGLGDKFEYILCHKCLCLQIKEIPLNLDRYYPSEYYSFRAARFPSELNWFNFFLKKSLIRHYMGYFDPAGTILSVFYKHPFPWIRKREINFNSKILDVGTGAGRKLLSLQRSGFRNLSGTDPYISGDFKYKKGLTIVKKDISEIDDKYDFITLHHSFEHMDNPGEVIRHISRLLNPDGCALIRIPVANSYVWEKYRDSWVHLDAPRHIFLHTTESMEILLKETDLKIDDIIYDSTEFSFTGSEKYLRNLPLSAPDDIFTRKEINSYSREAEVLNKSKKGDCACFYLKKIRS